VSRGKRGENAELSTRLRSDNCGSRHTAADELCEVNADVSARGTRISGNVSPRGLRRNSALDSKHAASKAYLMI